MGRIRDRQRAGWPANLYPCKNGFKYRHPVTKRDTWVGRDRAAAFDAARKANAILVPRNDLVATILGEGQTVRDAVGVFRREDAAKRGWATKTAEEYEFKLRRIEREIGGKLISSFGTRELAEYLRSVTVSDRARQQYRLLLVWIFACAVENGWIDSNPAEQTRRPTAERKRQRLTLEGYRAIHDAAPPWLQNAMDLSLHTLLRRGDICGLRFADLRDGFLWITPTKTRNSTGLKLKIRISSEMQKVIDRCRDAVLSPYVVHRLPLKARPSDKRAKDRAHHTQILPEQLDRGFDEARTKCGHYAGSDAPPTFHEIKSLGGSLYREMGWTVGMVQALMGHSSASMTKHYLEGHEAPWQEIDAGLDQERIGR